MKRAAGSVSMIALILLCMGGSDLYYADGYLYFEVTFSDCDQEYATRWSEGYRRLQTDLYRRKLDDGTMELLGSY